MLHPPHTHTHTHAHTHTVIFSLFRIHTFSTPNVRWCNKTSNPTRYRCGHPHTHAWLVKQMPLNLCAACFCKFSMEPHFSSVRRHRFAAPALGSDWPCIPAAGFLSSTLGAFACTGHIMHRHCGGAACFLVVIMSELLRGFDCVHGCWNQSL